MIVYGEELRPWIEALLDKLPDGTQFIGRVVNDTPLAVVGFHSWSGDDIELSCYSAPGGATRGLLDCIFGYVFGQLGCTRCSARIREDNMRSCLLVKKLGFKPEGRLRRAKQGHDVLIFGLLKEELRYGRRSFSPSGT